MKYRCLVQLKSMLVILWLWLFVISTSYSQQYQEGDFLYSLAGERARITGYTGTGGNVIIPDTVGENEYAVKIIGTNVFSRCKELTSVAIPASVERIDGLRAGIHAFLGCASLTNISVDPANSLFSSLDGVLFNKDQTILIFYPSGKQNASYIIPDTVVIPRGISSGTMLTSVVIPDSVTTVDLGLGSPAFLGCAGLTNISVDSANPLFSSLDGVLFNKDQTTLVFYPSGKQNASYTIPDSVTNIMSFAFTGSTMLTSVVISDSVASVRGRFRSNMPSFVNSAGRLANISVDSANPLFSSLDGVLFNKDQTTLVYYPSGKKMPAIRFPIMSQALNFMRFLSVIVFVA